MQPRAVFIAQNGWAHQSISALVRAKLPCRPRAFNLPSPRPSRGRDPSHRARQSRSHAAHHLRRQPVEDLRLGLPRPQAHQSGYPSRRDLCAAGAERRRQDDADQHHLRHRQRQRGNRLGRRPRQRPRLSRRPRDDRAGAAGADHRCLRDGMGHDQLQPRAVRQAPQSRPHRQGAEGAVAVGQEGQHDHDAVGRHEAARADRQGALARAADPVPRRADGRRRCGAAQGHVGGRARLCAIPASPSSSPPTTSTRPRRWPTASA